MLTKFPFLLGLLVVGQVLAQSTNFPGQLGSMPHEDGVTFRVWAPNANSVAVRGAFNGWSSTSMTLEGDSGYWSVDVPSAQVGQQYLYRINDSFDRRDPRARRVTNSNGNSIIYDPHAFNWGGTPTPQPWRNDLVIYQMHLGTFGGQGPPATFDHAIPRLDHLRDLGINAIKLMPVNEFAGSLSWGYNPADPFAIESDYGGPNALKRFVRAAHERGIAVFMDVVHNHYGPSDLALWRFDGWYENDLGGIYFYNDGRAHTMWGSTRPDFGRAEVRRYIRDQIMMFVEEYRIGGFRWDSVYSMIYTDWGHNQDAEHLLRDINWELSQDHPHVFRSSEDHAYDFSMNFESQWDVDYRWGLYGQVVAGSDSARDMWAVAGLLNHWPGWDGHYRVLFSEAHDYIAATHGRTRLPSAIHGDNPESIWARKRSLLAAGLVMTTPGVPMIFQGQELLETLPFHDDTPLRWDRTNQFAGIVQAYTDLIHARRNLREGTQGLKGTGINVHHVDNDNKVIAYVRWDAGNQQDDVMVIANFGATNWTNNTYSINFPSDGVWYSHFNSDRTEYSDDFGDIGPSEINVTGGGATVNMGMYSIQIFSQTPPGEEAPPPPPPPPTGQVTSNPEIPSGCVDLHITYDPAEGPLMNSEMISIHIGFNGWQGTATVPMTPDGQGGWTHTYAIPENTWAVDFVFTDGIEWDNNNEYDWSVLVLDCAAYEAGGLMVTNPASDLWVPYTQTVKAISGEAHGIAGMLTWTNIRTGAWGEQPAESTWTVPGMNLGSGVNLFRIHGARDTLNPNDGAWDHASNTVYASGWATGQNGGAGWGDGWILTATTNAGHFRTSGSAQLDSASHGWGLWANSGGLSEAVRPFAARLHEGDTVRIGFEHGFIDDDHSVGVAIENRFGQSLVEFLFIGGGTNYLINDSVMARPTGLPWTNQGFELAFSKREGTDYALQIGSDEWTGSFAFSSEALARQVRIWNASAGTGSERDVFVTHLAVSGDPLPPQYLQAEVAITRQDGIVGPPALAEAHASGTAQLLVPSSVWGQLYDIFISTNLHDGWSPLGLNVPGTGGDLQLIFTNEGSKVFYTIGTWPDP